MPLASDLRLASRTCATVAAVLSTNIDTLVRSNMRNNSPGMTCLMKRIQDQQDAFDA